MNTLYCGDALETLKTLPDQSVNCVVTSPPYFGLRDYGVDGQMGLEQTPSEYVANMTALFREAKRVLRDDGTLWLNIGDSYAGSGKGRWGDGKSYATGKQATNTGSTEGVIRKTVDDVPAKSLIGIPWRLAFALQDDGWILRSDIIWHKPNPMPQSVKDRPTTAHEYVFLFVKQPRYWYDAEAIREPNSLDMQRRAAKGHTRGGTVSGRDISRNDRESLTKQRTIVANGRNSRSVWTIPPKPYREAHFATFPEELPRRCILAGCPEGGVVLDPFFGSGTTGRVAKDHRRNFIGIELNPSYVDLAVKRVGDEVNVIRL